LNKSAPIRRVTDRWFALSGNLRGIALISLGTILFSLTDIAVKTLGNAYHPYQLSLIRYIVGFAMLAPIFWGMGLDGLKTRRAGLHVVRLALATLAQLGFFISVIELKLADATALMFSKPLFTTLVATIVLHELVSARRWTATAVGFAGVVVMMRPGAGSFDPVMLVAVGAAMSFAVANVIIRLMSSTEPPNRILFYYHVGGIGLLLIPALYEWRMPTGIDWLLLALVGFLTTLGMICWVRAFSVGEANAIGPMEYVRLIYAGLFGYFLFGEAIDLWTVAGGVIIVGSALFITRDEARRKG